jgi:hypothetical protein
MYTFQDFNKYLQLLNSFSNDISSEEFTNYFSNGVIFARFNV